jgi:hypothetical protein
VQSTADGGAETLRTARDEHAAAGKGQGGFHGVVTVCPRQAGGATIPEPVRAVAAEGFAR